MGHTPRGGRVAEELGDYNRRRSLPPGGAATGLAGEGSLFPSHLARVLVMTREKPAVETSRNWVGSRQGRGASDVMLCSSFSRCSRRWANAANVEEAASSPTKSSSRTLKGAYEIRARPTA